MRKKTGGCAGQLLPRPPTSVHLNRRCWSACPAIPRRTSLPDTGVPPPTYPGRSRVRRLLVPIDDRPVSDETLRVIADAARSAAYTIRLLYVPSMGPDADGGRTGRHQGEGKRRLQAEGLLYLDTLAASLGDVPIERMVRFGDVNMANLDETTAWAAGVVALSEGGRMRLSRP